MGRLLVMLASVALTAAGAWAALVAQRDASRQSHHRHVVRYTVRAVSHAWTGPAHRLPPDHR